MNAPVATNRLNLALATKKTISGPSSVASLNRGCGVVLSIIYSIHQTCIVAILRDASRRDAPQDEDLSYVSPHPEERALARVSKDETYSIPAIAWAKSRAVN